MSPPPNHFPWPSGRKVNAVVRLYPGPNLSPNISFGAAFGIPYTLAIHEGVPCYGIIYLRLRDLKVRHVIEVLDKFLKIEKEMAERTIIILTDRHLRIRPIIR